MKCRISKKKKKSSSSPFGSGSNIKRTQSNLYSNVIFNIILDNVIHTYMIILLLKNLKARNNLNFDKNKTKT